MQWSTGWVFGLVTASYLVGTQVPPPQLIRNVIDWAVSVRHSMTNDTEAKPMPEPAPTIEPKPKPKSTEETS